MSPKFVWVLVQIEWTDPPTYVGVLPYHQFTQNPRLARKFKDRRDAEQYVVDFCFAWPHKPTPAAIEVPDAENERKEVQGQEIRTPESPSGD